jgi:N-acetylmuramoyl-L-alanine amidase
MSNLPPPNLPPADEDREFRDWMRKRQGRDGAEPERPAHPPTPAAAFEALMRQAAASGPPAPPPAAAEPAPAPDDNQAGDPFALLDRESLHDALAEAERDAQGAAARRTQQAAIRQQQAREDAPRLLDEIEAAGVGAPAVDSTPAAAPRRPPPAPRSTPRYRGVRAGLSLFGGIIRSVVLVVVAGGLIATIFTWFTPTAFIDSEVRRELGAALAAGQATPTVIAAAPTPNWSRRIGIVSGHRGPQNDPGAVCPDGLTEAEINFNVAQRVVASLAARGYTNVDLLDEFDPRLDNYQAAALVSIHANTCADFGEVVSGFLISTAAVRVSARGNDNVLVECVARNYAVASGLQRRDGVTIDMTDYHTFREIHPTTPAAIIELGFMLADRPLLTERPDDMARGITEGILCFLEPGVAPLALDGDG